MCALERGRHHCKTHIRRSEKRNWLEHEYYLHTDKKGYQKGAIERSEPNFMCHALIPKEEVQEAETKELVDKIYDGSVDKLFAALLGRKKLSAEQIQKLKQIVEDLE